MMEWSVTLLSALQVAVLAAWSCVVLLTWRRYRRLARSTFLTLAHILRAVLWGEVTILVEIFRWVCVSLAEAQILNPVLAAILGHPMALLPTYLLLLITAADAIHVFRYRRIEALEEEHQSRLQIGRMAARLATVTDSLNRRNADLEHANGELARAEKKFRDFFEHAPLHYHTVNRQGIILDVNEMECIDLGYRREELVGKHISKYFHPSYRKQALKNFQGFWAKGSFVGLQTVMAKKDGTPVQAKVYASAQMGPDGTPRTARAIWVDITAQKKAEDRAEAHRIELATKNRELENRNRELSDLAHVISHDLKAPLRGMEAFLHFLEEDCGPQISSTGRSHIATSMESCQRLRTMIDDLIEFARFGREGKRETIPLMEIIRDVRAERSLHVGTRRATIEVTSFLPSVFGDRTMLMALFRNLIDNGIKYGNPQKPRVAISARPETEKGWVTIGIKDNGIGIAAEHHEKIFRLLHRLHGPDKYTGTGIGLAIVKKAVDYHQGQVQVESSPDQGSTFWVTLPAPPAKASRIPRGEHRAIS